MFTFLSLDDQNHGLLAGLKWLLFVCDLRMEQSLEQGKFKVKEARVRREEVNWQTEGEGEGEGEIFNLIYNIVFQKATGVLYEAS